ncbi:AAA family ATPase [Bradyrhizobium diazoefficiens]|nr:AAA family ATPase [Bradyrhizobium diazoefficiens]QQN64760.1 AAA family ATPase [Bradyrhizobium diazoefficiens]
MQFGIKNLRRLRDVSPVELKPITLLVGRNSSGKSSFLRLFPLLRQSLMTRTSSPILWYGDLVDFGTYSTAVSSPSQQKEICFSFVFDEIKIEPDYFWTDDGPLETIPADYTTVALDVVIGPADTIGPSEAARTNVTSLSLTSADPDISFELRVSSGQKVSELRIDGVDALRDFGSLGLQITPGTILPEILFVSSDSETAAVTRRRRTEGEFVPILMRLIRPHLPRNFKEEVLLDAVTELLSARAFSPTRMMRAAQNTNSTRWRRFVADLASGREPALFQKIRAVCAAIALSDLLKRVDLQLRNILSNVLYIGPARARSERYYRYQDLSVSEIDPDGKNFPMFLNSLSSYQFRKLSEWIEELFEYGISLHREGGHISINLTAKGNISNIVDTGYGVSQILPVLAQIWWARSRPMSATPSRQAPFSLLAIEQPELHLHPAHQALLADALVGEVGLSPESGGRFGSKINFLVETHSETLINRLGELVHSGSLNHRDVQILLFEPHPSGEHVTTVRTASFNEAGELVDWPYGFFQPTVD